MCCYNSECVGNLVVCVCTLTVIVLLFRLKNVYSASVPTSVDIDVGLESTSYKVAENFHEVEVCVTLQRVTSSCAIGFPFHVNFSTIDGSAGIYILYYIVL